MASAQEFSSPGEHMASLSSPGYVDASNYSGTGTGFPTSDVIFSGVGNAIQHGGVAGSSCSSNASSINFGDYSSILKYLSGAINNQKDIVSSNNDAYGSYYDDSNVFNQNSANKAMKFSAQQAQLNRDFQAQMSNTSYQRAVKDLESAGLNPILAYINGGASTPAGSSASGTSAQSAGYMLDEGHTGMSQIISSICSNLPQLMLASATSGIFTSSQSKQLVSNITDLANSVIGGVNSIFSPPKTDSQKWSDKVANTKNGKHITYNPNTNIWS